MNRFILSLIGFFTGCLYGCGQHDFKTVNADEFERIIANDSVQTVDVRTAEEFAEAHISVKGLRNIDVKKPGFIESAVKVLDKSRPVAVYCRSGRRSADAASMLAEKGYKVYDLAGGILDWQSRGKKTEPQK